MRAFEAASRLASLTGAAKSLLASAAIAGHGVALCPVEVFRREIQRGDLVVLSDVAALDDEYYVMVREDVDDAAVGAFLEWFQSVCAAELVPSP